MRRWGRKAGALPFSAVFFSSRHGAPLFRTLWLRLSGLGLRKSIWRSADSLQFHGGSGVGKRTGCIIEIRRWRPRISTFAGAVVAFFGCTIVFGLLVVGDYDAAVWQMPVELSAALLGLRFVVSFLILLVPTTAMGLTLPVIIETRCCEKRSLAARSVFFTDQTHSGDAWRYSRRSFIDRRIWTLRHKFGSWHGLHCCGGCLAVARFGAARYVVGFKVPTRPRTQISAQLSDSSYRPPWRCFSVSFGTGLVLLALEVIGSGFCGCCCILAHCFSL